MLNTDQVIDLLTLAAAYDRRTVGESDVRAWSDAAERGRWTFDGAKEAIKVHYANSSTWLMPGHITEQFRADRRQPAQPRPNAAALPAGVGNPFPAIEQAAAPLQHLPYQNPFSRWASRKSRRDPLTAEKRARIEAELDAARRAGTEPTA